MTCASARRSTAVCTAGPSSRRTGPIRPRTSSGRISTAEGLARLKALPVWNEAVRTEAATAVKVQTLGRPEPDPVLARGDLPPGIRGGTPRVRHRAAHASLRNPGGRLPASRRSRRTPRGRFCGRDTASASTRSSRSASSRSAGAPRFFPHGAHRRLRPDHAGGGAAHPLPRELGRGPPRAPAAVSRRPASTPAARGTSRRRRSTACAARWR